MSGWLWLMFPLVAAGSVWLAGRRDAASDPRLTVVALVGVLVVPWVAHWLPKVWAWPGGSAGGGVSAGWVWPLMVMVWLLGVVVGLVRLGVALVRVVRMRSESCWVASYAGVEVREHGGLAGPVAVGILRRMIMLPSGWRAWDADELELVLLHEHAHHARRDPLWRLVAELVVVVHWYHPLVRWMRDRWLLQCEYACDARVLERGVAVRRYASMLCDMAAGGGRLPALALAVAPGGLEARVRRMLALPPRRRLPALAAGAGLVVLGGLLAMCGGRHDESASRQESELRWSADPFPGNPR